LAVVQVVIYIGAIAVLMIFAIMLTRRIAQETTPRYNENLGWAVAVAVVFFAGIVWILVNQPGCPHAVGSAGSPGGPIALVRRRAGIAGGYVLPFELASVLLLAALIGAIVVAWEKK